MAQKYLDTYFAVDAVQWRGDNWDEIKEFLNSAGNNSFGVQQKKDGSCIAIDTYSDTIYADEGDYITKNKDAKLDTVPKGEFNDRFIIHASRVESAAVDDADNIPDEIDVDDRPDHIGLMMPAADWKSLFDYLRKIRDPATCWEPDDLGRMAALALTNQRLNIARFLDIIRRNLTEEDELYQMTYYVRPRDEKPC